ncbi:MAG TPA: hypothetical protein VF041_08020 [Gemmatimonadaceae bacterium]
MSGPRAGRDAVHEAGRGPRPRDAARGAVVAVLVFGALLACSSRRGDKDSTASTSGAAAGAASDSEAGIGPAGAPVDTGAAAGSTALPGSSSAGDRSRAPAPARRTPVGETRGAASADSALRDSLAKDSLARRDSERVERERHRIRNEPRRPVTPPSSSLVRPKSDSGA